LQDIYINRKFDVGKPPHVGAQSPVTHLYGLRGYYRNLHLFITLYDRFSSSGLQTNIDSHLQQKKHEQRETGWVNNFHLSQIDDRNNHSKSPKRPSSAFSLGKSASNSLGESTKYSFLNFDLFLFVGSRSRSSSPILGGRDSTVNLSNQQQQPTQPPLQQPPFYDRNQRYKCLDESVSNENLLLLGMYRLSEEQQQVYDNFVSMLSSFETIDVVSYNVETLKGTISFFRFKHLDKNCRRCDQRFSTRRFADFIWWY